MASHVVVIDTTFRRTTVKVTPGTYLHDVLDEACRKLNLKSSNYGLRHNKKAVDTSRTFRQTGLSSGAKLELVIVSRSPSVVSVALQLPESEAKDIPGGRILQKFSSDTTLWMILRACETQEGKNLNFTGRGVAQVEGGGAAGAGRIYYETPVLNILGRDLSSFTELQKTLAQLGLNSGSTLIRLGFRRTETPLEEAMLEIGQYFKVTETPEDTVTDAGAATDFPSVFVANSEVIPEPIAGQSNSESSTAMEVDPSISDSTSKEINPTESVETETSAVPAGENFVSQEVILGPDQRPIAVFAAPSSSTPKAALNPHDEADYEPTVAHAKLHQSRLQSRSQNQRLLSDAEAQTLADEKAARQATVKEVSIKVRFPDQLTVVSTFNTSDSSSNLYDFVKGVIVATDQPFALVWMSPKGPQTVPRDSNMLLIKDLGFVGRMLVNFIWEEGANDEARSGTTLKGEFASKAQELRVHEIAAAAVQEEQNAVVNKAKDDPKEGRSGGGKSKGGVPKWLKLPGKK